MPHHSYLLQTVLLIYCILPFCKVIILIIYHNKQGIKKTVSKKKKKNETKQPWVEENDPESVWKVSSCTFIYYRSLASGYKQLSGKKEYVNMHRTWTLEITTVCYNAKKQWLDVVVFAEDICVADISGFNKPRNDLIRICEFCNASFLGRGLAAKWWKNTC